MIKLKELVKLYKEMDFKSQKAFQKYAAKHKMRKTTKVSIAGKETTAGDATVHEAKKRNYKEEYKKYGSSKKAKKYRAELNAYNRKKGTYGNGDGLDASHKGGKIVGFEKESVNRGRAEKSRLKKEGKLKEGRFKLSPGSELQWGGNKTFLDLVQKNMM